MKKVLAMMLVTAMMVSVTACGKSTVGDEEKDAPIEVLTKVLDTYKEDEKFAAVGGDMKNAVEDAPGVFDVSDVESLDVLLGFPQSSAALIDEAASLRHMMLGNLFTAGVYHVTDTSEVEMLIADLQDNIQKRQWLDGFPDTLMIVEIGNDTLVSVFGDAEIVENFQTKLLAVYEDATISVEETIE